MFEKINTYYWGHFTDLTFAKQFHFASRQWLWNQDEKAAKFLVSARESFCGNNPPESVEAVLEDIIANLSPEFGSKNAAAERAPYFTKYPLIKKALPLLFRLLFIKTVYGIDTREYLYKFVSKNELEQLKSELLQDDKALAILSTHASNFLYLYHRFLLEDEQGFDIKKLYEVGQANYSLNNRTHLQLYIYLYTHCIIGESLFYKRQIPVEKQEIYQKMCEDLEATLQDQFENINLDNKFEILVCFRICGFKSEIAEKIAQEAENSLSPNGDFIIDIHNNNQQKDNVTLEKSEHRNVLAIISDQEFKPTDQAVA